MPFVLESTSTYPFGVCTISAWRRETSFPATTMSHPASRPNTIDAAVITYSRPSVRLTTRPPVLAVTPGLPAPRATGDASGIGSFCMNCVLPDRRSSTKVSS